MITEIFYGGEGEGEASFWASENYTGRVDFGFFSKLSFQHCENFCNLRIKSHCHVTCDLEKVSRNITLQIGNKKTTGNSENCLTTICVQPWSVTVFSRMFTFQTWQFPRQMCWLNQWKCFVWSIKLCKLVKQTLHILFMWRAGLSKLKTFFQVFSTLWQIIDGLKVNRFGWTYSTGVALDQDKRTLIRE